MCLCDYTLSYFDNPTCSGSFYLGQGIPTTCQSESGNGRYQTTICQSGQIQSYDCSDSDCNDCTNSGTVQTGCDILDGGGSALYACASSLPELPSYYSTIIYNSNNCGDVLLSYAVIATGHCLQSDNSSSYYMCNNGNPTTISCSDQACSQNCNANTVPSGCYPISGSSNSVYESCFTTTSTISSTSHTAIATMSSSTTRFTSNGMIFLT